MNEWLNPPYSGYYDGIHVPHLRFGLVAQLIFVIRYMDLGSRQLRRQVGCYSILVCPLGALTQDALKFSLQACY